MTRSGKLWEQTKWEPCTGGTEFGLWPTPTAQQAGEGLSLKKLITKDGKTPRPNKRAYNPETGQHVQITLNRAVKMWPTPRAGNFEEKPETFLKRNQGVRKSGKSKGKPMGSGIALGTAVKMWPTPTTRDCKGGYRTESLTRKDGKSRMMDALPNAVLDGKGTETTSGSLNPTWVEWLMGYPIGWTDFED
tara:strand:+ start:19 stop:588 length:570 start_codon:yes stop_codon:yes gene_type:complete